MQVWNVKAVLGLLVERVTHKLELGLMLRMSLHCPTLDLLTTGDDSGTVALQRRRMQGTELPGSNLADPRYCPCSYVAVTFGASICQRHHIKDTCGLPDDPVCVARAMFSIFRLLLTQALSRNRIEATGDKSVARDGFSTGKKNPSLRQHFRGYHGERVPKHKILMMEDSVSEARPERI